jgi:von Willebrand factor type A domain
MDEQTTLEHHRPRVTLYTHAELYVQASDAPVDVPDTRLELGAEGLRAALGVGEHERLECWLLVDRSGSVLFDRDELQEVELAWHFARLDSERNRIGILGFCGFGDYVSLFEFKTPLKAADRAMLLMANSGGGGTPTAEAVAHAARMLRSSTAEHRLVVVLTDAPANDTARCARAVRDATRDGVRVIGVLKPESRHQHPGVSDTAFMTDQFDSDWFEVESFTQTPSALLEHLATVPAPARRNTGVPEPPSEPRAPAGHERLVSAAAEALLALGDEAAYELSERTLDASDPHLRAVAHYLRMHHEKLHTQADELLLAALETAGLRGAPKR